MILIKNARILTCGKENFDNGYVIIDGTKIKDVGKMEQLNPSAAGFHDVVDAEGKTVFPGLVDGHCHIGMWEESLGTEGDDGNESGCPVTPHLRAIDAINPKDKAFTEALEAGITTVVSGPGSTNPIGGTFCALKTYGGIIDDMVIRENAAMKFAFGENPKRAFGKKDMIKTRMATAALIRESLFKAKIYREKKTEFLEGKRGEPPEFDMKMEALIPVVEGKMIVKAHAHRADDIFTALRIAKEFKLNMTIEHCSDGISIKDDLYNMNVGALVGPVSLTRSKPELSGYHVSLAAQLAQRGIKTAIITDYPEEPVNYLPISAAIMCRYGLSEDTALRMITIIPAMLCGIENRVGSIEAGKDADLIIASSTPLDLGCKIERLYVNGSCINIW